MAILCSREVFVISFQKEEPIGRQSDNRCKMLAALCRLWYIKHKEGHLR